MRCSRSFGAIESDDFDLTYFINSQLKFINQAIKGLFDYVDKKQNEQSNALDLLRAYLVDDKLNSRQAMIIKHAIKHLGAVYTIAGHKISQNIGYATAPNAH
jgi:Fic family protein